MIEPADTRTSCARTCLASSGCPPSTGTSTCDVSGSSQPRARAAAGSRSARPNRALGAHAPGAPRGHRSSRGGAWRWNWRCLGDPRRQPTVVPTFEEAADAVIAIHASTWKDGGKTEKRWRAILATYAFPRFGRKSVAAVTTADVLAMLVPHWATKRETMRKLRREISAIMRWAVAQGFREDNPAGESLGAALPKASQRRQHQRALPYAEVAGALAKVQESEA